MYNFSYWYTYFDSIFIKSHPILPLAFLRQQEMEIGELMKKPWPVCRMLPELAQIFDYLERFILSDIWIQCNCDFQQMKSMEKKLNNLIALIEVSKKYAVKFWKNKQWRIQASFVQYFVTLKHFFLAILPDQCITIGQAMATNKLCIQISQIQILMNHFLSHFPPIYNFLHNLQLAEQKHLNLQLFQEISNFCQFLPQLSKSTLARAPKIMKYICLNDPLDVIEDEFGEKDFDLLQNRKKSNTIEIKQRGKTAVKKGKRDECSFEDHSKSLFKVNGNKSERMSISSNTTEKNYYASNFFTFPRSIFSNESTSNDKNTIIQSNRARMTRKDSLLDNMKQPRHRSTTSSFHPFSSFRLKQSTVEKKKGPSFRESERKNSRANTFDNLKRGRKSTYFLRHEQTEIERRNAINNKTNGTKMTNFQRLSELIELNTGRAKGWALVREYVYKKIIERKVRRILQS